MKQLIQKIKWKVFYKYKYINDIDDNGGYSLSQKILMFLHITYCTYIQREYWSIRKLSNQIEYDTNKISEIIYNTLCKDSPCMIARFGSIEQTIIANYMSMKEEKRNILSCITGKQQYWWWNKKVRKELVINAGFFPNESSLLEKYCKMMIDDSKQLDIIETWFGKEPIILKNSISIPMIGLQESEPWWQSEPWTRYLENKNVLVIHPFSELIKKQYKNRDYLFKDKRVLPAFKLKTIKAVQSIGGEGGDFNNWFEALEWMKREMDRIEYDIALIGCGAYGFCLAAYAKSCGKKAVHMAGALQLLFGIKGSRWEDPQYHPKYNYNTLFNDYWVKPDETLKPKAANLVEDSCYW